MSIPSSIDASSALNTVKADAELDYGYVLDVMDRCRIAGAEEVALITKTLEDEAP